jgi:hypothetical protein
MTKIPNMHRETRKFLPDVVVQNRPVKRGKAE